MLKPASTSSRDGPIYGPGVCEELGSVDEASVCDFDRVSVLGMRVCSQYSYVCWSQRLANSELDKGAIGLGPAIAEELPGIAHFAD